MAHFTLELPSILIPIAGGQGSLRLEAETLGEAFRMIATHHPRLSVHVFDENGRLRQHVLCFLNERNTRWMEPPDQVRIAEGDRIRIMQAVSGG